MSQHHRWLGPVRTLRTGASAWPLWTPPDPPRRHQVARLQHAINRGEGGKEPTLIARGDGQDTVGQIHILLTLGHRRDALDLLGPQPMQCLPGTGRGVDQAHALPDMLLPAHNPAMGDRQDRTTAPGRHSGGSGGRDHDEDGLLEGRIEPVAGYRSHETPFVFFRRMASSTARSASVRSFS